MGRTRLEAFSDAVIAIILTIMVLELKVPHEPTLHALQELLPVFFSYVLSFIYIGIYWNNHHHLLHTCSRVTGSMLWANLHLLFWLSLFPFATAWMGENGFARLPSAFYGGVLFMAAIAYWILQRVIMASGGQDSLLARAVGTDWKGKVSPVLYIAAIAVAYFWSPRGAQVIFVAVALLWLVPDRRIEHAIRERGPAASILLAAALSGSIVFAEDRASRTSQTAAPLAIGDTFKIESRSLGETRTINVYRPSPYGLAPDAPLPVMYMPDGGIQEDFLHVAGLLQVLTGNGTMRPFLLVGIENTERRRDMTGPTSNEADKKIAPRVGGSAAFRAFIRTELMPQVKARYRTTEETAIVGESLAGLFVVETLVMDPSLFDTYIAFDPSLWWNDGKLIEAADARLRSRAPKGKRLYLAASADGDRANAIDRFARWLQASGLEYHFSPMPNETHATIYHPAALRAFRTLFAMNK